jgi:hypothetical protein
MTITSETSRPSLLSGLQVHRYSHVRSYNQTQNPSYTPPESVIRVKIQAPLDLSVKFILPIFGGNLI